MIQNVVLSDKLIPFSEEERARVELLLTKQLLTSNQDEDLFVMANALVALNSSIVINNRTYLCQLADNKIISDSHRYPVGLKAAAVFGCKLRDTILANLSDIIDTHAKMLNNDNLKSIHCASETLLLLKLSYNSKVAASIDVNAIAKRVAAMLRSDHTFSEEGNEPAAAINSGYAIKSLANLALLDPDRLSTNIVRSVVEKREEILLQIADAAIDDPSIQPLSLALQVRARQNLCASLSSTSPVSSL
jgi:hypothetical protein